MMTLKVMTLRIIALRIMPLKVMTLSIIPLRIMTLRIIPLSITIKNSPLTITALSISEYEFPKNLFHWVGIVGALPNTPYT
jgi:hypothetical protein